MIIPERICRFTFLNKQFYIPKWREHVEHTSIGFVYHIKCWNSTKLKNVITKFRFAHSVVRICLFIASIIFLIRLFFGLTTKTIGMKYYLISVVFFIRCLNEPLLFLHFGGLLKKYFN